MLCLCIVWGCKPSWIYVWCNLWGSCGNGGLFVWLHAISLISNTFNFLPFFRLLCFGHCGIMHMYLVIYVLLSTRALWSCLCSTWVELNIPGYVFRLQDMILTISDSIPLIAWKAFKVKTIEYLHYEGPFACFPIAHNLVFLCIIWYLQGI